MVVVLRQMSHVELLLFSSWIIFRVHDSVLPFLRFQVSFDPLLAGNAPFINAIVAFNAVHLVIAAALFPDAFVALVADFALAVSVTVSSSQQASCLVAKVACGAVFVS